MPSNERCATRRDATRRDARGVGEGAMMRGWDDGERRGERFLKDSTRVVDAWTRAGGGCGNERVEMCVCG